MSTSRIQSTKDYAQFTRSAENRPVNMQKHRKLEKSMEAYGFLKCFPIVVVRDAQNRLVVKDGQHRLAVASIKGLTVFYVEEKVDFDVAVVNSTSKGWTPADYAQKHAANGLKAYQEGIEFAVRHRLPISKAFSLLAGTMSFGNVTSQFVDGTFAVKDRAWADAVAGLYSAMTALSPMLRSQRFLESCMSVCRAESFDAPRLIQNAGRCREKLVSYSTREAYLLMIEDVYNFGRMKRVGIKAEAENAMKGRSPVKPGP